MGNEKFKRLVYLFLRFILGTLSMRDRFLVYQNLWLLTGQSCYLQSPNRVFMKSFISMTANQNLYSLSIELLIAGHNCLEKEEQIISFNIHTSSYTQRFLTWSGINSRIKVYPAYVPRGDSSSAYQRLLLVGANFHFFFFYSIIYI